MSDRSLVTLLHLCDSLFPTGGFSHSDGLEAATSSGGVSSAGDLRAWMEVCLDESLARVDGPTVLLAWRAFAGRRWAELDWLDADVHALRPSRTARAASRAMGARLVATWQNLHPNADLALFIAGSNRIAGSTRTRPAYPVAFGCVSSAAGIGSRAAVEGFVYTRLAATVSAAMRLMPIGQQGAHALLADMLTRVPEVADRVELAVSRGVGPGAFTPALDLATMEQQYVRSRLFLS